MFDRIVVGVDGGRSGRDAIALASPLAGSEAEMTLVSVHDAETTEDNARVRLAAERDAADIDGALVRVRAPAVGPALHCLVALSDADLLVVGSREGGPFGRVVLGEDARGSLDGANCSVAIAPCGYAARSARFADIGVGYDCTPGSEAALAVARVLAARSNAMITAMQVLAPPYVPGPDALACRAQLMDEQRHDCLERMAGLDDVYRRVEFGVVAEHLARLSHGIDLLVIGSRSLSARRRLVLGGTLRRLVELVACPLLVVSRDACGVDVYERQLAAYGVGASARP